MPQNPKRVIYIADDNEDFLNLLQRAFFSTYPDSQLEFFSGGQALLSRLEEVDLRLPDLIVLDLLMPGMDGLATVHKLHENPDSLKIPTIILSMSESSTHIEQCYQAGVDAYLVKPENLKELNSLVDTIGRHWLDIDQSVINYCIDFLMVSPPYSQANWAMLYTYGMVFKDGHYISIN
jgi:CheY-like chemotaxis protein